MEIAPAVAAVRAIAAGLGLPVDDVVVLHNSNKLTVRLRPADIVARVARHNVEFEMDIARRLALAGSPVVAVDPNIYEQDGFVVTLWTYHRPASPEIPPAGYARALQALHAGLRTLDVPAPHVTDRIEAARRIVALSPDLGPADRELLTGILRQAPRSGAEQLLHGEPHPGNLLSTTDGPRFIDFETCCRGPIEFDVAHAPDEVAAFYPDLDRDLLRQCRILVLAMITAWRFDPGDELPDGRRRAAEWLSQIRGYQRSTGWRSRPEPAGTSGGRWPRRPGRR